MSPALETNSQPRSLAERFRALDPTERAKRLASLSDDEAEAMLHDWDFWARPNQLEPPGDWINWLILAGRGFGKTRTGAETVRRWVQECPVVNLIGPTVELVARKNLHPALSDLLLETAQDVHGHAGLFQHKGEFPAQIDTVFPLSEDAARFYRSGKGFFSKHFYSHLPFWLASLTSRIVVVFVPTIVILIPALRSVPVLYRWRNQNRIYRWYRALLVLEKELGGEPDAARRQALLKRLDHIEKEVNKLKVPAFLADQFYTLRGHIAQVRETTGSSAPG